MSAACRMLGVACVCLFLAAPSAAQELHGGLKAGGAFSSLSNVFVLTGDDGDASAVFTGLAVGAFATLDVSEYVAIQPEVFYVVKGAVLDDGANGNTRSVNITYLEIPVLARLSAPAGGKIGLYALLGGTFGLKLDASLRQDDHEDLGNDVARTDLGVLFGLGVQGGRWLLEGRFSQGLWNIGNEENDKVRTRSLAVLAGVRF